MISISIGQGEVNLTPLQIANLGATIANRGYYYVPHVVRKVQGEPLDTLYTRRHYTKASKRAYNYVVAGMRSSALRNLQDAFTLRLRGMRQDGYGSEPWSRPLCVHGLCSDEQPKIAIAVYVENGGCMLTMVCLSEA